MIKFLACLFMVIDHFGLIFFPNIIDFRIIGRISMPLFAYCIARGFAASAQHGTLKQYLIRMIIFSAASQAPYMLMVQKLSLNIGFLWLVCLLFLYQMESFIKWNNILYALLLAGVAFFIPMDYGLYGLCLTVLIYLFHIKKKNPKWFYLSVVGLHLAYYLLNPSYGTIQLFALLFLPVLDFALKYDDKIYLNRKFFYCFYPIHIIVLLLIHYSIALK